MTELSEPNEDLDRLVQDVLDDDTDADDEAATTKASSPLTKWTTTSKPDRRRRQSDDVIEEEAPLEEPVAEQFGDAGDSLPEVDALEVVPGDYPEGDEVADEAAALGVDTGEDADSS